jgi:hypothetical protein
MLKKLKLFEGNGRHMHEISVEEACAIWGDGHAWNFFVSKFINLAIDLPVNRINKI